MIYPKIQGQNLYARWHEIDNTTRRNIIEQLCGMLRVINTSSFDTFAHRFQLPNTIDWSKRICDSIGISIEIIRAKGILSENFLEAIEAFVAKNRHVLAEQKIALVYWDAHFDNILVEDDKIV